MYKDLTAELRIFETVCKHSDKPDIADLARRTADAIEELRYRVTVSEAIIKRQSDIIQAKDRDLQRAIDAKLTHTESNADRIRSMSDEELAEWFYSGDFPWCVYEEDVVPCTYEDIPVHPCDRCLLDWLKQEAEDG